MRLPFSPSTLRKSYKSDLAISCRQLCSSSSSFSSSSRSLDPPTPPSSSSSTSSTTRCTVSHDEASSRRWESQQLSWDGRALASLRSEGRMLWRRTFLSSTFSPLSPSSVDSRRSCPTASIFQPPTTDYRPTPFHSSPPSPSSPTFPFRFSRPSPFTPSSPPPRRPLAASSSATSQPSTSPQQPVSPQARGGSRTICSR